MYNFKLHGVKKKILYYCFCQPFRKNTSHKSYKSTYSPNLKKKFQSWFSAKIMCADIDKTVGLAIIDLRDFIRNSLGLAYNIINIKDLEEWFCNVITILLSPFTNNNVVEAIFYLFGGSSATFDLSQYEQFDKPEMKIQD